MSEKYTAGPSKMASSAPSKPERAPKITYGASPAKGYPAKYFVDSASVPRFRYGSGGDMVHGSQGMSSSPAGREAT